MLLQYIGISGFFSFVCGRGLLFFYTVGCRWICVPRWDMLIKAGRDLKKVPPPTPTHPIPQNNNVAVLRTPCMLQTQAPRATVQIGIPFIRKSPDLLHQENFSKSTPHDQISVKHPAEGWRGDWRSPFAVCSAPKHPNPQD